MNSTLLAPSGASNAVSSVNFVENEIDRVEQISVDEFHRNYVNRNRPLIITEAVKKWPAFGKWSLEFFRTLKSDSAVHLEHGNVLQEETQFQRQAFSDYIAQLMDASNEQTDKAYLSVFKIFEEFPHLRADVDFSLLDARKLKSSTVGWIGPAGTVTGYHIDWGDNILAQIHGRKQLHLAAPSETSNMYVSKKFDQGTTISQVDLQTPDLTKFPQFAEVKHHRIVLNPGEMIFIPRGWWHHVESLDISISVSNLAYSVRDIAVDVVPHRIKQVLHDMGVWKCDCTCHTRVDGRWVRK